MSPLDRRNNAKRRIDEELVSVDALRHVLLTRCKCKDVHPHREKHDPPDFVVTIDGEPFPTEVTSIVSREQYRAQCREFAMAIRDRADSLGVLSGKYALKVFRLPRIPTTTSKKGRRLLDAAVAYIDATREQAVSPEVHLIQDEQGKINLEKVSADGPTVGLLWSAPAMWEGDIQSQLSTLIQQAIDVKKCKLKDAGIGPRSALLLLYDAFGYAEPSDAIAAVQRTNGYDWFHSIFWAASFSGRKNTTYPEEPGREGCFLFSQDPQWNRVGTVPMDTGA